MSDASFPHFSKNKSNLVGQECGWHEVGHRILHEWLWDYHKYHHSINTPTPVSTACIDPLDATIQAAIPRFSAATWVPKMKPAVFHIACQLCF